MKTLVEWEGFFLGICWIGKRFFETLAGWEEVFQDG